VGAGYRLQVWTPLSSSLLASMLHWSLICLDYNLKFTAEFAKDAKIPKLSEAQRRKAVLYTTNDINEGALGMLRIALRRAPNMRLFTYNSLMMIRQNNVAEYFATLDTDGLAFVRAEARRLAHGSIEKMRWIELAEHRFMQAQLDAQARDDKARRDAKRKFERTQRCRVLNLKKILLRSENWKARSLSCIFCGIEGTKKPTWIPENTLL
jgi:hypothetical protein